MTGLLTDAAMFILLVLTVGFAGIGVTGLLVFPEIRSRMYTATRAPVISMVAMIVAVMVYALSMFFAGGGDQYITLIIHVLVLLCIVFAANVLMYRTILKRVKNVNTCPGSSEHYKDTGNEK